MNSSSARSEVERKKRLATMTPANPPGSKATTASRRHFPQCAQSATTSPTIKMGSRSPTATLVGKAVATSSVTAGPSPPIPPLVSPIRKAAIVTATTTPTVTVGESPRDQQSTAPYRRSAQRGRRRCSLVGPCTIDTMVCGHGTQWCTRAHHRSVTRYRRSDCPGLRLRGGNGVARRSQHRGTEVPRRRARRPAFTADLLDPDQVDELIARVELEAGPIDVLVNNAGLETSEPFEGIGTETIRDVTRLNLEAPIVLTRQVLPGMLARRKGHLVFLSSLAGTGGFPGLAVYAGTKAGVSNFVASLRMELRDTPITTTVVAPGPVDTEMWDHIEEASDYDAMLKRLRLFQLIPKKSPEFIAKRTVAATKSEEASRSDPSAAAGEPSASRGTARITETLLKGVKLGPQVDPLPEIEASTAGKA